MVRVAGLFHDVGKMGITDDILMKNDKLDVREYEEIKAPDERQNLISYLHLQRNCSDREVPS